MEKTRELATRKGIVSPVKLGMAALAFAAVKLGPRPAGLSPEAMSVLAVLALVLVVWSTEALHVGASSLVALALLAAFRGVSPSSGALVGFASPAPYFLLGALIMGEGMVASGLADRMAAWITHSARGSGAGMYLRLVASMPLLPLLVPSAITRNAILVPVYQKAFAEMGLSRGDTLPKVTMLALAVLNPLASSAYMTGGLTSMTTATLVGGVTWLRWYSLMSVPYYSILFLGGLILFLAYRPGRVRLGGAPTRERERVPFSPLQLKVVAVLAVTSLLWLTDFLHGLHPAVPALLAAALLLLPPAPVLSWNDCERRVSWSSFLVIGTALSLSRALLDTGAAAWSAHVLCSALGSSRHPVAVALFSYMTAVAIHLAIPNMSACVAFLVPVLTAFTTSAGLNPLVCALVVNMGVDTVTLYPVQTATSIIPYQTGQFAAADVLKIGLALLLLSGAVVALVCLPYWNALGLAPTLPP